MAQKLMSAEMARNYLIQKNAIKKAIARQNTAIKHAVKAGQRECVFFEYDQDFRIETAIRNLFVYELGYKEVPIGFVNGKRCNGTKLIW